jgi:hypothetical protein
MDVLPLWSACVTETCLPSRCLAVDICVILLITSMHLVSSLESCLHQTEFLVKISYESYESTVRGHSTGAFRRMNYTRHADVHDLQTSQVTKCMRGLPCVGLYGNLSYFWKTLLDIKFCSTASAWKKSCEKYANHLNSRYDQKRVQVFKQKFPLIFSELMRSCNSSTDCVELPQYQSPWDSVQWFSNGPLCIIRRMHGAT